MLTALDQLLRRPLSSSVSLAVDTFENERETDDRSTVSAALGTLDSEHHKRDGSCATLGTRYSYRFHPICWGCGNRFYTARSTTKTCSGTCRSRLRREREKVKRTLEQGLFAIGDLQRMIDSPDPVLSRKAKEALRELAKHVKDACLESGV